LHGSEEDCDPEVVIETGEATVGPYVLHREIARGGMATIHVARLVGDEGFSRIVAAKRMLPELASDAEFVAMFLDEARIAARVVHRNVVPVLDVVASGGEVILVQEYVHGVPLNTLLKNAGMAGERIPVDVAVSIASQILTGLQAAHDTRGPRGKPLGIVHRDVSPGNIMIGVDGTARLLDFGVAKAAFAAHITKAGTFKGKRTYSAPEQLQGVATPQSDIYSLAVVLWELLTGRRMHTKLDAPDEIIEKVLQGDIPTVTELLADQRAQIDDARWLQLRAVEPIVNQGLALDPADRWSTAAEMEKALVRAVRPAASAELASWAKRTGKAFLDGRDQLLATEEAGWRARPAAPPARGSREIARMPPDAPEGLQASDFGLRGNAEPDVPRFRPRAVWILAGAGLLGVIAALIFAFASSRAPKAAPSAPLPSAPLPSAPLPAAPLPSAPLPSAVSVSPEARGPKPEAPSPPPRAPARRQAAKIRTPPPPPIPSEPASRRSAPNCNPPYYFKGSKKIFKPACL
jgi:hypothetical protein